jgi:hypothetical protein
LVPIEVVATVLPLLSVLRIALVIPVNHVVPLSVVRVEEEFAKVWSPVQELALARFKLNVCVPEPLYALPESPEPAERLARVPPSETPLMVELASWLLPMVLVETKEVPLYERRVPEV